jgi:hypothetical protein
LATGKGINDLTGKFFIIGMLLISICFSQELDSVKVKSPKKAAISAMVIPGGGQVYNGKYLKALAIFGLESAAIYSFYNNNNNHTNWDDSFALPQHRYLEKRNKYAWWSFFIYVYGIIDAIVDAHLDPFEEIMNENLESNTIEQDEIGIANYE